MRTSALTLALSAAVCKGLRTTVRHDKLLAWRRSLPCTHIATCKCASHAKDYEESAQRPRACGGLNLARMSNIISPLSRSPPFSLYFSSLHTHKSWPKKMLANSRKINQQKQQRKTMDRNSSCTDWAVIGAAIFNRDCDRYTRTIDHGILMRNSSIEQSYTPQRSSFESSISHRLLTTKREDLLSLIWIVDLGTRSSRFLASSHVLLAFP